MHSCSSGPKPTIRKRLDDLCLLKLAQRSDGEPERFEFRVADEKQGETVSELGRLYRQYRLAVVELLAVGHSWILETPGRAPEGEHAEEDADRVDRDVARRGVASGDEVLMEHPTYELLQSAAQFLGAAQRTFVRRFENSFRLDPAEVERAITPRTRLIVITNLHNPSGVLAEERELRQVG